MTFRQVEIFLAVARARNFTRAAETLHVSQSTLSQHVLELERELGVRLFDRLGRAVALTEAGRLLEDHAPRELDQTPLLMREQGSATRLVTERTLRQAGVKFTTGMELDHIEAIKQAVMAGLGVAFVSMHAVRGELATRRLCGLRLKGL